MHNASNRVVDLIHITRMKDGMSKQCTSARWNTDLKFSDAIGGKMQYCACSAPGLQAICSKQQKDHSDRSQCRKWLILRRMCKFSPHLPVGHRVSRLDVNGYLTKSRVHARWGAGKWCVRAKFSSFVFSVNSFFDSSTCVYFPKLLVRRFMEKS